MHWNHRVIKYNAPPGEDLYIIHEVYYDDEGKPDMFGSSGAQAEDLGGLRQYVEWMLKALDQPVLTPADFGLTDEQALRKDDEPSG